VSERLVPDLARAVLDGTPIDWAGAESSADEASRPLLAELAANALACAQNLRPDLDV